MSQGLQDAAGEKRSLNALLMLLPAVLFGLALGRWLLTPEARAPQPAGVAIEQRSEAPWLCLWSAAGELGGGRIQARLMPLLANLEPDPAMARALGRGPGAAYRLELAYEQGSGAPALPLSLENVCVWDANGAALSVLPALSVAVPLPWRSLWQVPAELRPLEALEILLWGRAPLESAELVFAADQRLALVSSEQRADALPRPLLRGQGSAPARAAVLASLAGTETTELEQQFAALRDERDRLRLELAHEREQRIAREQQWLEYNRLIGSFEIRDLPIDPRVLLAPKPAPAPEPEAPDTAQLDAQRLGRTLNARLRIDGMQGLDLLEAGSLVSASGESSGWLGPIVMRQLDPHGRLQGALSAERLRLELSRSSRSVTLVLEQGHEVQDGQQRPFEGGSLRLELPHIDPNTWLAELGELFAPAQLAEDYDDGRFELSALRVRLNELLKRDVSAGYYQLRGLSGVLGDALCEVELVQHDKAGGVQRQLLADRMYLREQGSSIEILLEDGASVRGDQKAPFLDGRCRIFLPRAELESWRSARLPGLGGP